MGKLLSNLILDLAKCPNQKTCTFTFMHFLIGALPEVQNWFRKPFSHKVLYNYYSNDLYLTKSKNGFPIVFSNLAWKLIFFGNLLVPLIILKYKILGRIMNRHYLNRYFKYLDGVGAADNRPFTGDTWHMTCDRWHGTCDMWHLTCDRWGEVILFSKMSAP